MDDLGLHHAFLLLAIDDARGVRSVAHAEESFTLAGAFVAEMQLRDRLVAVEADRFALPPGPLSPGVLGQAEERLVDRSLSLKQCLSRVAWVWFSSIAPLRRAALDELVAAGVLEQQDDRFLSIRWRSRWPERDPTVERALRAGLADHVRSVSPADPPGRQDLLLSLLRVAGLLPEVLAELATSHAEVVQERTRLAPIGRTVHALIEEQKAAAAAVS